ncbi:MAG: ORF6N domain-containing protein [Bacteroidetes bacterium]|nr:ORF6N domain-containing protein [Bacteroidota bacterium]
MQLLLIQKRIHEMRGLKVMLDFDLAELYQVETRILNQAVKRNIKRFPEDFMFELTEPELDNLRSQIVISSYGGRRYLPYAFTEQGVAMLSGILKSDKAIEVNISIMRAFVLIRQYALTYKELAEELARIEQHHDKKFDDVYEVLNLLLAERKKKDLTDKRRRIGYKK